MVIVKSAGAVLGVSAAGVLAILGWYDAAAGCALLGAGFLWGLVRHE